MFGATKLKAEISKILRETQTELQQAKITFMGDPTERKVEALERMLEKFVKLMENL
jgi:hypothetical protein